MSNPSLMRLFFTICASGFLLDQLTKYWARIVLKSQSLDFGLFRFDLVFNTGAAYGVFSDYTFFLLILGIAVIAYILLRIKTFVQTQFDASAYGCLIAGALGNTFDRLIFAKVTDFINVQIIPVFNIADTLINVGVIILLYQWLIHDRKNKTT